MVRIMLVRVNEGLKSSVAVYGSYFTRLLSELV